MAIPNILLKKKGLLHTVIINRGAFYIWVLFHPFKPSIMAYSVESLTSVADCDLMLGMAARQKSDLSFRRTSLERQRTHYAENAVDVEAELIAANAEYTALETVIATLPEGQVKDDNTTRLKKLDLKRYLLNEKKESYGGVALIDKEFDLARVDKQLDEADAFIAALQARKAAL